MARNRLMIRRPLTALLVGVAVVSFGDAAWSEPAGREKPGIKTASAPPVAPPPPADSARDSNTKSPVDGLQRYESRWYHVFHNLSADEAKLFATHMDAVFDEYTKRFANLSTAQPKSMPLYLFRKQSEYEAFMASININATNTGGMFFVTRKEEGLAVFVGGRPITQTFAVLQHEGFHQFAFRHIGPDLPIWVNEGLAQYFEDGVLVFDRGRPTMYLGPANANRIASIKQALAKNEQFDFDTLLNISSDEWSKNVVEGKREAALQYDQSWSIAYFLIVADNGKYRDAFEKYLKLVAQRRPGGDADAKARANTRAFAEAFGTNDTTAFKQRWTEFARALEPDPINQVVIKLEFLGQALKYLSSKKTPMPATIAELRAKLQHMRLEIKTVRNGVTTSIKSSDESLYSFDGGKGPIPFKLLKSDNAKVPLPRIVAPGLHPEPTLVWYVDGSGELTMDVAFKK